MRNITFELVHKNQYQRFYKASKPIIKFPNKHFVFVEEVEIFKKQSADYIDFLDDKRCEYICISDAITHNERLVFVGGRYKNNKTGKVDYSLYSYNNISRKHTMLIHNGDINSMLDDEVYLRQLSILNK